MAKRRTMDMSGLVLSSSGTNCGAFTGYISRFQPQQPHRCLCAKCCGRDEVVSRTAERGEAAVAKVAVAAAAAVAAHASGVCVLPHLTAPHPWMDSNSATIPPERRASRKAGRPGLPESPTSTCQAKDGQG